ncbi:MAG: DUF4493 domain-containing protein, partial [Muribaculaceae bacterium]|nr:DUF4493 domain-containing protein [Muribaculaceae bacterium]
MKTSNKYMILAAGLLLSACASEAPFDGPQEKQKGSFAKSALNLQVHTDHVIKQTKAEEVTLDDVVVTFFTPDHQLLDHYIYGYMPSVVVLNQGDYYLSAVYNHFGEEKPFAAAFDAPFYQGDSKIFQIKPNEITSDLDVVKCELQNVMTSVVFDDYLKQNMADDSYVELKINENGENPLNFNLEQEGGKHYGYFECKGEQTLVATFHGKINGAETSETKTVSNVSAGNHYRITFKLHDYQGENTGSHDTNVVLDASVTKTDKDGTVSIEEMGLGDSKLDENERPGEDPENPDDPNNPDDPVSQVGPEITANEGIS